jgi:hypothetical protein
LRLELDHVALVAGEAVTGVLLLRLPRPARIDALAVAVNGRELLHPATRYAPFVYTTPVPRPWGRSRTGALRIDFSTLQPLVGQPAAREATLLMDDLPPKPSSELAAGEHDWPFSLHIPPEALPTYGGIHALVEHEVLATAVIDGRPLEAWAPLHVWRHGRVPPPRPLVFTAPAAPQSALDRAVAPLRAPLKMTVTLAAETLDLWQPLEGTIDLENPEQIALGPVSLELVGTERVRHMSATDQHQVVVSRRRLRLASRPEVRETFCCSLPRTLAPTLLSPRFRLDWSVRVTVTVPWGLGISGEAKVVLHDGGGGAHQTVEEVRARTGLEEL